MRASIHRQWDFATVPSGALILERAGPLCTASILGVSFVDPSKPGAMPLVRPIAFVRVLLCRVRP